MQRIILFVTFLVATFLTGAFTTLLTPLSLLADSPKEIVESVVADMKSQKSPEPILDHVHWPTAFSSYPQAERQAMQVKTPEELKSHMKSVMSNPKSFIEKQVNSRVVNMPAEQQAMMKQMMTGMMSEMDAKISEMKEKIGRTDYEINNEKINGNAATVDITAKLDGKVRNTTVEMQKIDGRWYFPTIDFAKEQGQQGIPG